MSDRGITAGAVSMDFLGPSDEDLMLAFQRGSHAAFTDLVRRYQDRLWRVAVANTFCEEDAADCLQEALLRAYQLGSTFRGDAQISSWLYRIVVNQCFDRRRRNLVRVTQPIVDNEFDLPATAPVGSTSHTDSLSVRLALAKIPQAQAEAILMVDMHGYSVRDAAKLLGVREGTVKSRRARGRQQLLTLLQHSDEAVPTLVTTDVHLAQLPQARNRGVSHSRPGTHSADDEAPAVGA